MPVGRPGHRHSLILFIFENHSGVVAVRIHHPNLVSVLVQIGNGGSLLGNLVGAGLRFQHARRATKNRSRPDGAFGGTEVSDIEQQIVPIRKPLNPVDVGLQVRGHGKVVRISRIDGTDVKTLTIYESKIFSIGRKSAREHSIFRTIESELALSLLSFLRVLENVAPVVAGPAERDEK